MGKNDNTAGWILTTLVYSLGGRMEVGTGTSAKATLNNPQTVTALNMLKKMRWTDNSMGSNFDYGWSDINQAFAAGNVGMYISGSDVYTNLVPAIEHRSEHLRARADPARQERKKAGVLGGGTLAAVRPDANAAARAAAVKWIDFFYEQPLISKAQAIRNAKTLVAGKQPVGVPALPVFNKAQYDLANTWIKPYINVPQAQMKPFTTGIFKAEADPGAGGVDAERVPLARPGGAGGPHGQERRHRVVAPAGEQLRAESDLERNLRPTSTRRAAPALPAAGRTAVTGGCKYGRGRCDTE